MWCEVYEPLVINGHTTPIFVKNSHVRPFSIIPKANTYGFLTNEWCTPEIQECDLWQGNICGVRCTSLWSMINGHTTPIFVRNSHERPFSIIPIANTWRSLRDKFLLNFQGYRRDTDALAELSLCKQQEKETLREYYHKFLTLKSQLPSVDDQIAIHYAISGLRAGVLYSQCIRDPPKNLQELYQLFEKYARSVEHH
jgi:hypothetical protein